MCTCCSVQPPAHTSRPGRSRQSGSTQRPPRARAENSSGSSGSGSSGGSGGGCSGSSGSSGSNGGGGPTQHKRAAECASGRRCVGAGPVAAAQAVKHVVLQAVAFRELKLPQVRALETGGGGGQGATWDPELLWGRTTSLQGMVGTQSQTDTAADDRRKANGEKAACLQQALLGTRQHEQKKRTWRQNAMHPKNIPDSRLQVRRSRPQRGLEVLGGRRLPGTARTDGAAAGGRRGAGAHTPRAQSLFMMKRR
jgi:hypothetical protein